MKRLLLALSLFLLVLLPRVSSAQVIIDPLVAKVDFTEPDETQPDITSYQAALFPLGGTASILTGPVVPKTLVTVGTAGPWRLTYAQLGITLPACTVVTPGVCPQYFLTLAAIGPSGTSTSPASDPFALAPLPLPKPAAPSLVHPVP